MVGAWLSPAPCSSPSAPGLRHAGVAALAGMAACWPLPGECPTVWHWPHLDSHLMSPALHGGADLQEGGGGTCLQTPSSCR